MVTIKNEFVIAGPTALFICIQHKQYYDLIASFKTHLVDEHGFTDAG